MHLPGRGARSGRSPGSPQRARRPGRSGARVLLQRPRSPEGSRHQVQGHGGSLCLPSRFLRGWNATPACRSRPLRPGLPCSCQRRQRRSWTGTDQSDLSDKTHGLTGSQGSAGRAGGIAPWRRTAVDGALGGPSAGHFGCGPAAKYRSPAWAGAAVDNGADSPGTRPKAALGGPHVVPGGSAARPVPDALSRQAP